MKATPFKIVEFENRTGTTSFRVTGMLDGKQVRKNFGTIEEATGEKQALETRLLNMPATPLRSTRLTQAQIEDTEIAFSMLNGQPLLKAVKFFVDNWRDPVKQMVLRDAFAAFLDEKRKSNKRPDTILNLRLKAGLLVTAHGDKLVSEILPEHLREVIFTPTRGPVGTDNVRRAISCFFTWATEQGYCVTNPTKKIAPIEFERDEPEILPIDGVHRLLSAASDYKSGATLPYVALGLFCAIRPAELARLSWDAIDLESQTVTISSKIAKLRARRIVEMSDNAVSWLLPHAAKRTPLRGVNWRKDFEYVKRSAGYGNASKKNPDLKRWTPDIMRHTGISHHLAKHQHEGKTATWAGNSPDVIQRHYKGLVKQVDTDAFWSITPSEASRKILKMA